MGSASDWPTMQKAVEVLDDFGVPNERAIVSAHRTPDRLREFATGAADRGLKAIIAGNRDAFTSALAEKMLTYANHLGLYSEEIGPQGEALGNFPQAFTHMGLISAAFNLNRKLGQGV